MRSIRSLALVVVALTLPALLAAAPTQAASLALGDPAPPLAVAKWVQGKPVTSFENGKVYVVEFWATWCGPCKATIPHINELSKKNPDVTFVGVSIMEEDESAVEPFVKQMGDKMTYRVATDAKVHHQEGDMADGWMKAAGLNGIPTAFIVDKAGKVAWIGFPMEMDKPLAEIVAGTFDVKKEAARYAAEKAVDDAIQEKVMIPVRLGRLDKAVAGLDELLKANPEQRAKLQEWKIRVLLRKGDLNGALAVMDDMTSAANAEADTLSSMASVVLRAPPFKDKRDADRALKWSTKAVEMTQGKDAFALGTLALAHAYKGDFAKAAETQQRAVDAAEADDKADQENALEAYKAKRLPDAK